MVPAEALGEGVEVHVGDELLFGFGHDHFAAREAKVGEVEGRCPGLRVACVERRHVLLDLGDGDGGVRFLELRLDRCTDVEASLDAPVAVNLGSDVGDEVALCLVALRIDPGPATGDVRFAVALVDRPQLFDLGSLPAGGDDSRVVDAGDVVVSGLPDPMRAQVVELPARRTGVRVIERTRIGVGIAGVPRLHELLGCAQTRGVRHRWGGLRVRLEHASAAQDVPHGVVPLVAGVLEDPVGRRTQHVLAGPGRRPR